MKKRKRGERKIKKRDPRENFRERRQPRFRADCERKEKDREKRE